MKGLVGAVVVALSVGITSSYAGGAPGSTGGMAVETEPLSVRSVLPAANGVARSVSDPIELTLTDPLDPDSFDPSAFKVFGRWSGVAEGRVAVSADGMRVTFSPTRDFHAGEWVTAELVRGVRDARGDATPAAYTWGFWMPAGRGSFEMVDLGERMVMDDSEGHVQPYGAYAGDFNGDGYSDLAIPNEVTADVRIMLNDGQGNYEEFAVLDIPMGEWPSPNEGADFNGDGIIDFVVGNAGNDLVSLFTGNGDGTFRMSGNTPSGTQVRGVCILDLNGDGWPDVASVNMGDGPNRSTRGTVSLLINDGSGRLERTETIESPGRGEKTCAATDANGDGIEDLFVGAFHSNEVLVYLGDGNGLLEYHTRVPAGGGPWMVVAGDVNGDGHVDALSANRNGDNLAILLGDGHGNLGRPTTYPVGEQPMAVDVGDIDGDGDLDTITSNYEGNDFTLYENVGEGRMANQRTFAANRSGSCAVIHDRDRDGDMDITGIDEIADRIFLWQNPGG